MGRQAKNIRIISIVGLVVAYFPFLYASQHLFPLGFHEWDWISFFSGNLEDLTYLEIQQRWYQNAGGRFTSTALLATLPYWYDLFLFRIIVLAFLIMLPLSIVCLVKQFDLKKISWILFASIWVLYLDQLTNIYDSLLRPTCMPIYHLGLIGVFVFAGLIWAWKRSDYKKISTAFLAIVVGIITVGTNEVSLTHLLLIGGFAVLFFIKDKKSVPWQLVIVMLFVGVAALFSITAQGNIERQNLYPDPSITEGLFLSVATSIFLWTEWLTNSLILPMIVIWAWIYFRFISNKSPDFTHPKRWLFALIVLCPLSLFPLLYGTGGSSLPERVIDLLFLCSTLLFIGFLFSVLNVYQVKNIFSKYLLNLVLGLMSVFITLNVFLGGLSINREIENRSKSHLDLIEIDANVGLAYLQLLKDIPNQYNKEMHALDAQIQQCKHDKCFVDPITTTDFIGYDPIYDRMWTKGETGISWYFNKKKQSVKYKLSE